MQNANKLSFRIVDGNDVNLPEGVVGRIQIKGDTVTIGYYKNDEINEEVFSEDGWFDTGDLGFIFNGSMSITGRAKDIIIINGVNYNNSEIEAVIEEVEGVIVSYTAVCGVRDSESDTDQMAIFYCSDFKEDEAIRRQIENIKRKVNEKIGLQVSFVIPVGVEEIPKTNSIFLPIPSVNFPKSFSLRKEPINIQEESQKKNRPIYSI